MKKFSVKKLHTRIDKYSYSRKSLDNKKPAIIVEGYAGTLVRFLQGLLTVNYYIDIGHNQLPPLAPALPLLTFVNWFFCSDLQGFSVEQPEFLMKALRF